jgi:hypothetical protein
MNIRITHRMYVVFYLVAIEHTSSSTVSDELMFCERDRREKKETEKAFSFFFFQIGSGADHCPPPGKGGGWQSESLACPQLGP